MKNTKLFDELRAWFNDKEITDDWIEDHVTVSFDDHGRYVTIIVEDMNEQDYKWIKGVK